MRGRLVAHFDLVEADRADVVILNACAVTQLAEKKARQAAHRVRGTNPGARIILCGCLADALDKGWSRFPEADLVFGGASRSRIIEIVTAALNGTRGRLPEAPWPNLDQERSEGAPQRVRVFLKIQDGCSRSCTYCRPRQVRGPSRSKTLAASVKEAENLVEHGASELVLTGINLAEYAPSDGSLALLLERLLELPRLLRLRLASIDLAGIDEALLGVAVGDPRLCRHFHIPLQSGSDTVLRRMARPYSLREYLSVLDRIRAVLPGVTFGSDIIVGFPGEDEAAFRKTLAAIERAEFSNLHVFRYSPRPGTPAVNLSDQVSGEIQRERAARVDAVWAPIHRRLLDARVGKIEDVLIEERRAGRFRGYTAGYHFVSFTSPREQAIGALRPVRITAVADGGLEGVTEDRPDPNGDHAA
jgi:threonylcarbamoyladenosine tRNA methylthiotransferase MtaB